MDSVDDLFAAYRTDTASEPEFFTAVYDALARDCAGDEDLVQDAMLRFLNALPGLRPGALEHWLSRTVRRLRIDRSRRRQEIQYPVLQSDDGNDIPYEPHAESTPVDDPHLLSIPASITGRDRELVSLIQQGNTYQEIAVAWGVSIDAILKRASRLRKHVRIRPAHSLS